MQPHEQAQFLRAIGGFIAAQVKMAVDPLVKQIETLQEQIAAAEPVVQVQPVPTDEINKAVATAIAEARTAVLTSCLEQIATAIENLPKPADGANGRDAVVDYDKINDTIVDLVTHSVGQLPAPRDGADGKDGKDGADAVIDGDMISQILGERVLKYFEENPVVNGKDGVSPELDFDYVNRTISDVVSQYFKDNPVVNGKDGISVSTEFVVGEIGARVKEFINSVPPPKDGKDGRDGKDGVDGTSVTLDDLRPMLLEEIKKLPPPLSVASFVIDRDGHLVVTMTDGTTKNMGLIVGRDGAPGKPGADGLGFKDMSIVWDGERRLTFKFTLEDRVEELFVDIPVVLYRGVWKDGSYRQGDSVSRSGSTWIAVRDTDQMPNSLDSGWVLSCKKGGDGRDGKQGPEGPKGKDGRDGRDLTQMGFDGKKW